MSAAFSRLPRLSPATRHLTALLGLAGLLLLPQLALIATWAWAWLVQLGRACLSILIVLGSLLTGPAALPLAVSGLAGLAVARALRDVRRRTGLLHAPAQPVRCLELEELAGALGLSGRVQLVSDPRPLAHTLGLWRPRIVVSTGLLGLLDRESLVAVLAHEREHLRCREPLRQLLGIIASSALFFLPLAGELHRRYRWHREVEADDAAARVSSDDAVHRALMQVLSYGLARPAGQAVLFDGRESPGLLAPPRLGRAAWAHSLLAAAALTLQVGLGFAGLDSGLQRATQCPLPGEQALWVG